MNCLAKDVTIYGNVDVGSIAGGNDNGTLSHNYYNSCTVGGKDENIGCYGGDVTANDGALSLHTIAKPNDVNNGTSATITYNNTSYWAQGKTITLSGGLSAGAAGAGSSVPSADSA